MPSDSGDRRPKPSPQEVHDQQLPCPRCDSTNTKFCYYNNYNLSQPRHFCKSCRRYWTQGGTLRNVPIGGGTRKNSKRSRPTTTASPCSSSVSNSHEPISSATPISSSSPSPTDLLFPLRHDLVDLNAVSGGGTGTGMGFTSLLHSHTSPGFLALGGFGMGIGVPSFDELGLSFDMGRGVWSSLGEITDGGGGVVTGGGGSTWQFGNNVGGGDAGATFGETEGFGWPELAISSTPRKGVK